METLTEETSPAQPVADEANELCDQTRIYSILSFFLLRVKGKKIYDIITVKKKKSPSEI